MSGYWCRVNIVRKKYGSVVNVRTEKYVLSESMKKCDFTSEINFRDILNHNLSMRKLITNEVRGLAICQQVKFYNSCCLLKSCKCLI